MSLGKQRKQRQIIFASWFRIYARSAFYITDLCEIVLEFAEDDDIFDEVSCHDLMKIENNGTILSKTRDEYEYCNAFGSFVATPGRGYMWKVKLTKIADRSIHIGIIEADKYLDSEDWWNEEYGYSYQAMRNMDNYFSYVTRGVIEIELDLQHENVLYLSRSDVNNKHFNFVMNVKPYTDYKLAIGMFGKMKTVQLLSFDVYDINNKSEDEEINSKNGERGNSQKRNINKRRGWKKYKEHRNKQYLVLE